jgi:hypothetical protein
MIFDDYPFVHWAFDGVLGSAVVAAVGAILSKVLSKTPVEGHAPTADLRDITETDSRTNSLTLGKGALVHGSPIVVGSHNTVNVSHPSQGRPDGKEKESLTGVLATLSAILGLIAVFIYPFSSNTRELKNEPKAQAETTTLSSTAKASNPTQAPEPRSEVGIAFGEEIQRNTLSVDCVARGVTCLGESQIRNKTIQIPVSGDRHWTRVALLVSTQNLADDVENGHIVVSTSSPGAALNYPGLRDGVSHNKLEFTPLLLYSTSLRQEYQPFWVDIALPPEVNNVSLSVRVQAQSLPSHTMKTQLQFSSSSEANTIPDTHQQTSEPNPTN